ELAVRKLAGTTMESLLFSFAKESSSLVGLSLLISLIILAAVEPLTGTILGFSITHSIKNPDPTSFAIVAGLFIVLVVSPIFMTIRFIKATPNRLLSTDTLT